MEPYDFEHDPEAKVIAALSPDLRKFILAACDMLRSDERHGLRPIMFDAKEALSEMWENKPPISMAAYDTLRVMDGGPAKFTTLGKEP